MGERGRVFRLNEVSVSVEYLVVLLSADACEVVGDMVTFAGSAKAGARLNRFGRFDGAPWGFGGLLDGRSRGARFVEDFRATGRWGIS